MTAGKVMSAIKVDMCRQQPQVPQIVAPSAPSVLDLQRNRRRGAARVCLFGVPEPGATRKLYNEMLDKQHKYMLDRYQFDIKTDRYVGDDDPDANQQALQQRLQGEGASTSHRTEGAAASEETQDNNRLQEQEEEVSSEKVSVASNEASTSHQSSTAINTTLSLVETSSSLTLLPPSIGAGKCAKASVRNNGAAKPYDKSVRPITGRNMRRTAMSCLVIEAGAGEFSAL